MTLIWIIAAIIYTIFGIGAAKLLCAYNDERKVDDHIFAFVIWPFALLASAFVNFEKK